MKPALHVVVELEELPVVRLVVDSGEDEQRLRAWLDLAATRRRMLDAIDDELERLGEAA